MQYIYTDAYHSIKAPDGLKEKILCSTDKRKTFNFKHLISVAASVIILTAVLPAYVGFTNPDITVSQSVPMTARYTGMQIPVNLDLDRESVIEVSEGRLEGYNAEPIKGNLDLIWDLGTDGIESCSLTIKDAFKTTVYILNYNENNGSWAIKKN